MPAHPKRILIVSHTFPPDGGVGGRRWAKFAKYLRRAGVEVEVLAAERTNSERSLWTDDVAGISVLRYAHKYPKILNQYPQTIAEKISYRLAIRKLKMQCKGNPYDRANLDRNAFLDLFRRRMDVFKPEVVVVSGAPFNLLHYAAEARDSFPDATFVGDLRDPWIGGHVYGYGSLSPRREAEELRKEAEVVEAFDLVISPWQSVVEDVRKRHPAYSDRIKWLPHVWDEDDFGENLGGEEAGPDMLYGGNLYEGFEDFPAILGGFAERNGLSVSMHTSDFGKWKGKRTAGLEIKPPLPTREFFGLAARSGRLLFLIPDSGKDGFPTKLLEYANTGRPVAAVGFAGSLSRLIEDRGLGKFFSLEEASENPEKLFGEWNLSPDREWVDRFASAQVVDDFLKMSRDARHANA